ncbi:DUF642 domain-containing protein [Bacteriovoracaceae bacterium]|nr:DUF642 domain-containing protein [Bacteriovoracaceae bacterium]
MTPKFHPKLKIYRDLLFTIFKGILFIGFVLLLNSCGKEVNKEKKKSNNAVATIEEENPLLGPIDDRPNSTPQNDEDETPSGEGPAEDECTGYNLVWNHSFEDHPEQKKKSKKRYQSIPHWENHVSGSEGFEIYYHKKVSKLKAHSGNSMIQLDGKSGKKGDSGILQVMQTRKDSVYKLKFFYAGHNRLILKFNQIKVYWNSHLIAVISTKKREWKEYEFLVVAEDETSNLSFKSQPDRGSKGGFLDSISLKEVCD